MPGIENTVMDRADTTDAVDDLSNVLYLLLHNQDVCVLLNVLYSSSSFSKAAKINSWLIVSFSVFSTYNAFIK